MAIITIVGAGMMGSAMSVPARDNGHETRVVGTHLDRDIIDALRATGEHPRMRRTLPVGTLYYQIEEVGAALCGADLVICGVSSFGVDWFADTILPLLPPGVPVLAVTKGLQSGDDMAEDRVSGDTDPGGESPAQEGVLGTFPDLFARRQQMALGASSTAQNPFCAVGGPCTSYELADRHHSAVAFCGHNLDTLRQIRALLATDYYHIALSTDVLGVEIAVALKNAFALGVTLAIGLAEKENGNGCVEHYNTQAALFGQSVREMSRLLALLGGGAENIVYGTGDLYVTIFGGRTRLLGTLLGRGLSFTNAMRKLDGVTLESVVISGRIAQAVRRLAASGKARLEDYPLLMHVDAVLTQDARVDIPWDAFIQTP